MTSFKIITPAYNCKDKIDRTLWSVVGQTHDNWQMILLDDMSNDGTGDYVLDFAIKHGFKEKIIVKTRDEKYGETRNTYEECRHLDGEDVVVRLDAGDYLTDLGCFEVLHREYTTHDPAVIWTNQRWTLEPVNRNGKIEPFNLSGPIDIKTSFYKQPWATSHLKTFRVRDFKGLNPKNFKTDDGDWIMIACDQAVFLPMLERARLRKRPLMYIPRVMYHYDCSVFNRKQFFNERAYDQKDSAEWIRERGYLP